MAKDPAFLFYSQDFIVGVQTMSFEDRGKYITILAQMHQQGRMNEESISFMVGSVSDSLRFKFAIDKYGLWYNKRLEEESEKRAKFTESRRNNGLQGGRGNKKDKAIGKANAKHMATHMEDENEDENKNIIVKEKRCYFENVFLKDVEYEKLIEKHGKQITEACIDKLSAYKLSNGKKYKSDYGAINSWVANQVNKDIKDGRVNETKAERRNRELIEFATRED